MKARPKGVHYFFVHEDGSQVTRAQFENYLDICNLHTRWAKLLVKPHGFCVGGFTRPHPRRKHPEHQVPFALKQPEELFEELPR